MMTALDRAHVAEAVAATGLAHRGIFAATAEDRLPLLPDGRPIRSVLLLGWHGRQGWDAFAAAAEAQDGAADPLDRWSVRVIGGLAEALGGVALFPFGGPPWWPFQRWAARAEPLAPSPLGMFIHPEFGLWHAYRGAVGLGADLAEPVTPVASPCESCDGRPCLSACPNDAYSAAGYDLPACIRHLESPMGALCRTDGCRARDACPVGRRHRYAPDQIRFLMQAFRAAHTKDTA